MTIDEPWVRQSARDMQDKAKIRHGASPELLKAVIALDPTYEPGVDLTLMIRVDDLTALLSTEPLPEYLAVAIRNAWGEP